MMFEISISEIYRFKLQSRAIFYGKGNWYKIFIEACHDRFVITMSQLATIFKRLQTSKSFQKLFAEGCNIITQPHSTKATFIYYISYASLFDEWADLRHGWAPIFILFYGPLTIKDYEVKILCTWSCTTFHHLHWNMYTYILASVIATSKYNKKISIRCITSFLKSVAWIVFI